MPASATRRPVNTQFRAVYAGGPVLGAGTSPPVRVVVRQLVVLRPTGLGRVKSVPAGPAVTFTATVRPIGPTPGAREGDLPVLAPAERALAVRHEARRRTSTPAGAPAGRWAFTSRGQWYVRAVADPTQTNANSYWSPLERYFVY